MRRKWRDSSSRTTVQIKQGKQAAEQEQPGLPSFSVIFAEPIWNPKHLRFLPYLKLF